MSARQRVKLGAIVAVLGALVFVVASAYLVARAWPAWLAGTVGAVAFPVLPIAWHLWAERKRRAKLAAAANVKAPTKRSSSSPADRFLFRMVGAAVLVIGPMIAVGRFEVVRAAWHHGLWFLPGGDDAAPGPSVLERRVPADAEAVVRMRGLDDYGMVGDTVLAWAPHRAMIASDKPQDLLAVRMAALAPDEVGALAVVPGPQPPTVLASADWRAHVGGTEGPSAALADQLARAPADAALALAYLPHGDPELRAVSGWIARDGDSLSIDARFELVNEQDAARAITEEPGLRAKLAAELATLSPACRDAGAAVLANAKLARTGAALGLHATVTKAQAMTLVSCAK
jgi:hypothetical protein